MTVFVPVKELENQLAHLAAKVEAGETVVVTQHGRPEPAVLAERLP